VLLLGGGKWAKWELFLSLKVHLGQMPEKL